MRVCVCVCIYLLSLKHFFHIELLLAIYFYEFCPLFYWKYIYIKLSVVQTWNKMFAN